MIVFLFDLFFHLTDITVSEMHYATLNKKISYR